jgi:AraC-like DNA-binding protein
MLDINNILFFFFSSSCMLGIICAIILMRLNTNNQKHTNRLLALGLLSFSFIMLFNSLFYIKDFYLFFPHLWRVGLPFQYLAAPFFYLYIRATLNSEVAYSKWDWLLFLPAFLHFMELTPFYLMPTSEKVAYIKYVFGHPKLLQQQNEGMLPSNFHLILKTGIGVLFQVLEIRLLIRFYRNNKLWLSRNLIVWNWLKKLTGMLVFMYVFLFGVFAFHNQVDLGNLKIVPVGILLFFVTLTLLFNPSVLYGIQGNQAIPIPLDEEAEIDFSVKTFALSDSIVDEYKEKLEAFMIAENPYFIKGYSIKQLASDCDIPAHHLSIVINREYGLNYADFINGYRIDFIINNRENEKWSQFSLEGLASEAGFNSRSSFINAFKKVTNQTPSAYFGQKTVKSPTLV